MDQTQRLLLWARNAGRCAMCRTDITESHFTARTVNLGEAAHNVGATTGDKSPRGDDPLPEDRRDLADNLLLLCSACHTDVDKSMNTGVLTVDWLRDVKLRHEGFVRHVTGLDPERRTVVVRVIGTTRSTISDIRREDAAEAVLGCTDRYPFFPLSPDRQGIEIDLRQQPGEHVADTDYFRAAAKQIDQAVAARLRPGVEQDLPNHVSVFAFARLPLLVHLGSRLDDTLTADVYERHRTGSWAWPDNAPTVEFRATERQPASNVATDAVLVVNVSGTVGPDAVPEHLRALGTWVVEPVDVTPQVGTVSSPATLASFENAVRRVLGTVERDAKAVRRLHLFAATPICASVKLGQAIGWGIHPSLVVYDQRPEGPYEPVLEVTAP